MHGVVSSAQPHAMSNGFIVCVCDTCLGAEGNFHQPVLNCVYGDWKLDMNCSGPRLVAAVRGL